MVTSTFFNNYGASNEQYLLEDLIIESIKIYGIDMYYLPRKLGNLDPIYLQDDISLYDNAIEIEFFVKNIEGFEGEGSIMSKFGLEIRDQITFTISKRRFEEEIGHPYSLLRPRESDLIYYPLNHKLFQIKYVENKPLHYPLGILPTYDVFCELWEYSNERFNTGIEEIDSIQTHLSTNIYDYALMNEAGKALTDQHGNIIVGPKYQPSNFDPIEDNSAITKEANTILDFSEDDPFSEGWKEDI